MKIQFGKSLIFHSRKEVQADPKDVQIAKKCHLPVKQISSQSQHHEEQPRLQGSFQNSENDLSDNHEYSDEVLYNIEPSIHEYNTHPSHHQANFQDDYLNNP